VEVTGRAAVLMAGSGAVDATRRAAASRAVECELGRGSDERRRVVGGGLQQCCARRRRNEQARVKEASASSGRDASRHGPARRAALRRSEGRGGAYSRAVPSQQRRPACEACFCSA
jgi:hypothetical protein